MRNFTLAFGVIASIAFANPARADVPPPNSSGCMTKAAGDACEKDDKSAGSCVTQTCSKLDYSMGTPPKSVDYECLLCSGAAPADTGEDAADGGCAVPRKSGMSAVGALGAWIVGATALILSRRARSRGRKSNP